MYIRRLAAIFALVITGCAAGTQDDPYYENPCVHMVPGFDTLSAEEAQWSLENDVNTNGNRFTCWGYTAAFWMQEVLDRMVLAVQLDDASYLELLVTEDVQLYYDDAEDYSTTDAELVLRALQNQQELYGVDWADCIEIDDLMLHPYQGIAIGLGSIWIFAHGERIFLTTVNSGIAPNLELSDFCHE